VRQEVYQKPAYSWSLNREYSSSPTLTGDPPYYNYLSQDSFLNLKPLANPSCRCRRPHTPQLLSSTHDPIRAGITHLWNQNLITNCHVAANPLPIFVQATRTNGQNPRLVQFLNARFREVDAGCGPGFSFDALD
jgi:hypothetical protein